MLLKSYAIFARVLHLEWKCIYNSMTNYLYMHLSLNKLHRRQQIVYLSSLILGTGDSSRTQDYSARMALFIKL